MKTKKRSGDAGTNGGDGAALPAVPGSRVRVIFIAESRLHNRRVRIGRYSDGDYLLHFRSYVGWREIRETKLRLTEEATVAMLEGIQFVSNKTWRQLSSNRGAEGRRILM